MEMLTRGLTSTTWASRVRLPIGLSPLARLLSSRERIAKIQSGAGSLPRDCTITDISSGGVKVVAEYLEIPPQFTIIFSTGDSRQCRLAWRIGCEFGA